MFDFNAGVREQLAPFLGSPADVTAGGSRSSSREQTIPRLADFRLLDKSALISPRVVIGVIRLTEVALVMLTGLAISLVYVGPVQATDPLYLAAYLVAGLLSALIFQAFNLYEIQAYLSYVRQFSRLAVAWNAVFAILVAGVFFLKIGPEYSRVWLAAWYLIGMAVLLAFRMGLAIVVKHWSKAGRLNRRAVIVGGGARGEELIRALEASEENDIRICGVFDDRSDERSPARLAGYPKLGNIDELVELGRETRLDLLIVSLPLTAENRLLELLKKLWVLPVDIRLSAHTNRLRFRPRSYSYIGNLPFIPILDKPIADWDFVLKWLFDKLMGTLILIAAAPVMLLVALAIKLDSPGPVFFRQKRYGFNNELIEVFKFRSMRIHQQDANASKLVTKNDPRVTRVGRFIRKTSLDELPQLFNVLNGSLSLVGPRPHALQAKAEDELYADVVDGYFARHRVKPGITGWAQVNGWRGETDTSEKIHRRVEHDLFYIENWSVFFDLAILFKTPFTLFRTKNAY